MNELIEQIKNDIDYVDSLICITRDSCEQNLYTVQQVTLELAIKYINNIFETLSKF